MKPYLIAEVGTNHNGNIREAIKYVKKLAEAGANAIKFQLGKPEEIFSFDSFKSKKDYFLQIKKIKKRLLSRDDHCRLYNLCRSLKVDYLCSAFDISSLKFLNQKFNMRYFKIPSGEIFSLDMLKFLSKIKKPVILSTGLSREMDLRKAIQILKKNNITLLHCVSSYPAKIEQLNLNYIKVLKSKFKCDIGYSDHYPGIEACIASYFLGATIIEKHVTFNRNLRGPDHKSSCTVAEFKILVDEINRYDKILGNYEKIYDEKINKVCSKSRKSLCLKKNVKLGDKLKKSHICFKRPGNGISPFELSNFLNKKIYKNLKSDRILRKSYFK